MYELVLKQIYEDLRVERFYIPYNYEGLGHYSNDELAPGYKSIIYSIGGALVFALLVFNALLMASGHFILGIIYFGVFIYLILVVLDKWF